MAEYKLSSKIIAAGEALDKGAFTFKKALLLCFFADGLWFAANMVLGIVHLDSGFFSSCAYLGVVLFTAARTSKDELRRIFVWRTMPVHIWAALLIMFFGFVILSSEFFNLFLTVFPIPEGLFGGKRESLLAAIVLGAFFPGFTEETFFRGILLRRFCRVYSRRKALLFSAALFGIMHLNPWQAVNTFIVGLFLGWVYCRYKSIWPCIFLHAYHNVLANFMLYTEKPYGAIFMHPLWVNISGITLFGLGLLMLIVLYNHTETKQE
ncbi:CPBP family intramembrane metalloprotease [Treponema primitia]|uniref:CPBP family intramembrane glutamic endopeptidase n=1 Tax=Treponema primitia TaxID=88058 RepID=UPI00397FA426